MHLFSLVYSATLFFIGTVNGVSIARNVKVTDVFVPQIFIPNITTTWYTGHNETVSWNTSNAPVNISNLSAVYLQRAFDHSLVSILAFNFSLHTGSIEVKVPYVKTDLYFITLFGDSGDQSDNFLILSTSPVASQSSVEGSASSGYQFPYQPSLTQVPSASVIPSSSGTSSSGVWNQYLSSLVSSSYPAGLSSFSTPFPSSTSTPSGAVSSQYTSARQSSSAPHPSSSPLSSNQTSLNLSASSASNSQYSLYRPPSSTTSYNWSSVLSSATHTTIPSQSTASFS